MADCHSAQVHSLFLQDVELVQAERAARRVGRERNTGPLLRPGGGAQNSLLDGGYPVEVGADLADQPGLHVGAVDSLGHVALDLLGDLVGLGPPQVLLIVGLAVPAAAQDYVQARPLGHLAYRDRVLHGQYLLVVLREAAAGLVHQRHAAGVLVPHQLLVGELLVVEHVVAAPGVAHQVEEDVLVGQGEPEVAARNWPGHCHNVGHALRLSSGTRPSPRRSGLGRRGC